MNKPLVRQVLVAGALVAMCACRKDPEAPGKTAQTDPVAVAVADAGLKGAMR